MLGVSGRMLTASLVPITQSRRLKGITPVLSSGEVANGYLFAKASVLMFNTAGLLGDHSFENTRAVLRIDSRWRITVSSSWSLFANDSCAVYSSEPAAVLRPREGTAIMQSSYTI